MKKDNSTRVFGVCLLFFGMGLFLGIESISLALGICGFGLFLIFLARPLFRYLGNAFKEMSESM